jgi:Na+/phosphate symporter
MWQAPLLAMFAVTFAGTVILHFLTYSILSILGSPLPVAESLMLITVPSLLLNLLLAIAIYPLIRDLAGWVYPVEVY